MAVAVIPGAIWLVCAAAIYAFLPGIRWRKTAALRGEQTHTFDDAGCTATLIHATSQIQWSFYTAVLETPTVLVLQHNNRLCNVLPKRAFTNDDLTEFRTLIETHVARA